LLAVLGFPVVATSGNLSDEPICSDEGEVRERLGGIADLFLVHNRPIVRHVDDSIVRVMLGRELVLRRARGYAPLPVRVRSAECGMRSEGGRVASAEAGEEGRGEIVLAVGAHLKNAVALTVGPQVFISQHIGDLETEAAYEAFRRVIGDFERLYEAAPSIIAADAHPDYLSTKFARELTRGAGRMPGPRGAGILPAQPRYVSVQHHIAHVLSCLADNDIGPPALGVSWDGTGYGLDGTIWGCEFFLVTDASCERVAQLRRFRLPGGERAVKEPRRAALGLLFELFGEAALGRADLAPIQAFSPSELDTVKTMLARGLNSPWTSSAGRLFDAVASLLGLRQQVRFEGQAAMELEFATEGAETDDAYLFPLAPSPSDGKGERGWGGVARLPHPQPPLHPMERGQGVRPGGTEDASDEQAAHSSADTPASTLRPPPPPLILDPSPLIESILADLKLGVAPGRISARFHNALAEGIIAVARQVGQERVALSGGCFQNRYLTERAVRRLRAEGFRAYWHQRVPPNDGGIALGQVVAARRGCS
jgi:hydrogenase maturation protein HypF